MNKVESSNPIIIQPTEEIVSNDNNELTITSFETIDEDFYYEDDTEHWIIDFKQGFSGTFVYSRQLNDDEILNWGHGGKILDENGKECYFAECSFFSSRDGIFAVEFPKYMEAGKYTYVLYQLINDKYCEATIDFEIK